ncbi:hypothetical protein [Prosthecobacter sp.]|uniref:hypothetical protein n=1 Tax=Prosthecobacter sp. TaxID=1965333 RepID=UPI002489A64A|nr:hypothetical protein [Prosthecobacter sp.]MDI1310842.1 hypothetical protein [Prosthecobacter sp.]
MDSLHSPTHSFTRSAVCLCTWVLSALSVSIKAEDSPSLQTNKDAPSSFHKYFGQRVNSFLDAERQIAKLDIDADMNHDGMIQNIDPADNGAFEATPPGMILGVGEMTRFVVRLLPYRVDFEGEVVVTLEVEGINRGVKSGEFASMDEELQSMGHIRVWKEKDKKTLLLDSRDPAKRVVEFTTQYKTYPYNLPMTVPRAVYVEGVKPSPQHIGDVRVLCTVSHRALQSEGQRANTANATAAAAAEVTSAKQPEPQPVAERVNRLSNIKSFRTSFDHILVTVQPKPTTKQFINDNNEGVWVAPPGWTY